MGTRSNPLVKIVVALVAVGALGYFFFQSVRSTRAEPYTVAGDRLRNWMLALETPSTPTDPMLSLRPPSEMAGDLFRQIFARHAESMSGPVVPAMPLVLQEEFDRAFAGHTTPDALLTVARKTGLESMALEPRCMAYRRESAPGLTRQVYFLLFDAPAFGQFREEIAGLASAAGRVGVFNADALSAVLLIAASDPAYSRWLPISANPDTDCVAPIGRN